MSSYKIILINGSDFTKSTATTTRIRAYCKGLRENGFDIDILNSAPYYGESEDGLTGFVDGMQYSYMQHREKSYSKIKLVYYKIEFLVNTINYIRKSNKKSHVDIAIFSFDTPLSIFYYGIITKLFGIKSVMFADEYPVAIRDKGKPSISRIERIQYKLVLRLINGRVFINEKLVDYYNNMHYSTNVFILPTIIDCDRFQNVEVFNTERLYMCYVGGMDLTNDNVDLIIDAFAKIANEFPTIDLFLYGSPKEKDKQILLEQIQKYQLENRVFLKGYISYQDVPKVMCNSYLMVTSQANTKRAEGGLPTKVGEYMMSGVPSVFSDVSSISEFIVNQKEAYIVKPDDIDAYSHTLLTILNNYEHAKEVAQSGKDAILQKYSYKVQGNRLFLFLQTIINNENSSSQSI